jgi:hypothetical protein
VTGDEERALLTRFYSSYKAEKIDQIPVVLERYKGREKRMWTVLKEK